VELGDLPATAFLTAAARAEATLDPRVGLVDEFAQRFAELCPPSIRGITRGTAGTQVVAARTMLFDRLLAAVVQEQSVDVWVNLGAGFDARAYRLPWPGGTVMVEVDSAAVFDIKDRLLPVSGNEGVRTERLRHDIRDLDGLRGLLAPVVGGLRVGFLSEGLLPYFPEAFVARLSEVLASLAGPGAGGFWICDVVSDDSARLLTAASRGAGTGLELFGLDGLSAFETNGWVCERLELLPTARAAGPPGRGGGAASRLPDSVMLLRS
jgi:methyltransferase (TIGR00027 family)